MTCAQTSTLGVYLLGALDPEDRSAFESHLSRCDTCRSELVRLAPLPGLLNQITPADFEVTGELPVLTADAPPVAVLEPPEPLPALDPPLVPETPPAREPRKRYWLVAAAAAVVVVLTVGGIIGYQALRDQPAPTQQSEGVVWSATSPDTGVRADVQLIERSWGTELRVWMANVPPERQCKMRVVAKAGYREHKDPYAEVAGWWGTTDQGPDHQYPGSTSIELPNIFHLEFVDNYGNMLVKVHRPE